MKKSFGTWFLLAVLVRFGDSADSSSCSDGPTSFCAVPGVLDLLDTGISDKTIVTHLVIITDSVVNLTNDAFRAFTNLESLSLDVDMLTSEDFMPNVFRDINISQLTIKNSMVSFNQHFANVLNDLRSLTTLNLEDNKNLVSFHSAGITTFDRLTTLTFTAENIICDCELSWLRNYLINLPAKFDKITQILCNIASTSVNIEESNFCSHSDMDPLTCVSCDGGTNEDCNLIATNETCSTSNTVTPICMNTISNTGKVKSITKGCSTQSECSKINSNTGRCFGRDPSQCIFCCRGNFCNHPETAILDGYYPQGYPFIPENPTTQPLTSTSVVTTTKMTTQLTTVAPTTTTATTPLQTTTSVPTTSVSTTETTTIQSTTPSPTTTYTTYVTTPIITPEITTATTKATTMMTTTSSTILTTTPQTTTVTTNPTTPLNDFETTFISTTENKLTTTIPSTTTIQPTTSITTSTRPTTTTSPTTQPIPDTTTLLTTPTITTTPITTSQMTTTMAPGTTTSIPGTTTSTPGTTTSTPGTTTSTPGTTTSTPGTTTSTPGTTTSSPGTTTSTPGTTTWTPGTTTWTQGTTTSTPRTTTSTPGTTTSTPRMTTSTPGTTTSTPGTTTSTPRMTTSTPPTTTVAPTTTTMFTTTTEITSKPTTTTELSTTAMSSTQTEVDRTSGNKLTTTSKNDLTTEVVTTTPMVLYCEEEEEKEEEEDQEEEEDGNYGEVEWPRTMVGLEVVVQCPFTRDGLPQNATRMCTLNGQSAVWMSPDYSNCITISQGLEILAQENVTTDNFMDVSETLVELTEESERLEEEDVENAVTVFEAVSMNLRGVENETEEVLDNLFVTVNQLLLAGETELMEAQMKAKTSSRIIQAVEETVMSVQIQSEDYISKSETFDVAIIKVNEETRQSDIQFPQEESKKNGNTDDTNNDDGDDDDGADDTKTKIVIPKEAIKDATRVQFVLYKDTSFFQTITNTEETTTRPPCADEGEEGCLLKSRVLSSFVISASVGNQKISNLENKVTNTFNHVTDDKYQFTNNSQCVFWDFDAANGRGDWSTDGCTVSAISNSTTTCECDHLTNFAVLLDIYGNANEIQEDHRLIITYISIAGAGLSFISLVLALASYACAGRLRKDKRVKVLLNLMTALLFMNMAFLFDVVVSELGSSHKYLCFGAAVAMHYTLLCVMTWMAVEAFTMYLALVKVFDSKRRRFMLKMFFLGWGLPAVIVGCSVWIDRENYGYENNLCYLKRIPFFISFFVPVCIVLIWNSVVYILVARQMHRLRKRQTKFNQTFSLADQLRASFSLTFLLGLTWLFAFFAFGELNLTFTYLFAITNTLQGFVVFLFHCVFKREIRRQWQALCCPCIPLLKEGDDGTYSRSKTGTNGTSSHPNHSQLLPMNEPRNNRSKDTRSRSWYWRQSGRSGRESTATDLTRLSATGSEFSPAGTINSNTTSVFA